MYIHIHCSFQLTLITLNHMFKVSLFNTHYTHVFLKIHTSDILQDASVWISQPEGYKFSLRTSDSIFE